MLLLTDWLRLTGEGETQRGGERRRRGKGGKTWERGGGRESGEKVREGSEEPGVEGVRQPATAGPASIHLNH